MRICRFTWWLLFSLLLQVCAKTDPAPLESGPVLVEVRTVHIEPGSWQHRFKSYGLVIPAEEYKIGVDVSATVKEVLFREGDVVEVGDLLLRLDARKLRLRLEGAKAGVEEARARYEQAISSHQRNRSIYASGVISEQAFLQSEAALKSAEANLRRAESAYDLSEEELAAAEVRSPVKGVVTHRSVEAGQNVSPIDHLGVVRVKDALRVETFVSQKDVNFIAIAAPANVTSPAVPGLSFVGRVDQVASSAEPSTGNFEVGVVLEDAGNLLKVGMSAMVEFVGSRQQDTLAVPRSALVDRGRRLIVYKVLDDRAFAIEPTLGVGNSDQVPVLDGLSSGDEIIVSNLRLISDGALIRRTTSSQREG